MTESRTCPRCGAPIAANQAPDQPCPRCLLQAALHVSSASANTARIPAPSIAELQPHFGGFEILELVGEGGMGAVYRARDKKLERTVALKILTVASNDGSFDERFAREARAMAQLAHPHIAAVHEHGKAGPWSFLVMEFVEGDNLRRKMRAGAVTPKEALAWVGEICDALQYAHEHGVVHRDIKPENVLIDASGHVKVVDFGLAKLLNAKPGDATLTSAQQALGTWHYMAPEQYERPRDVDHRADIYSLGVVFYELLTGQVPVGRFDLPSQKIQVDVRLDDVVLKALAREPEKRYQHANEVKSDVENLDSTPTTTATDKSAHHGAGYWVLVGLGGLLGLFTLFGCLGVLFFGVKRRTGGMAPPGPSGPEVLVLVLVAIAVMGALAAIAFVLFIRRRREPRAPHPARERSPRSWSAGTWIAVALGSLLLLGLGFGCFGVLLGRARTNPGASVQVIESPPSAPVPPTQR